MICLDRARSFAAALAPLAALLVAGCDVGQPSRMTERLSARQAQLHPPALWRVEQVGWDGRAQGAVEACLDDLQLESFRRPAAEVNGRPCVTYGPAVARPHAFVTRCTVDGGSYLLRVRTTGDPAKAFETSFSLTPTAAGLSPPAVQYRRFRRLGACPAGWGVGQQRAAPL